MTNDTPFAITENRRSWLPMAVIALGQAQMSFNVNALPVSLGGIVAEFDAAPTTVGTAISVNALAVGGLTMAGAKLGQRFGSLRLFRAGTALLAVSMVIMAWSQGVRTMIVAQMLAGVASAAIVPSLVVLIVDNYSGAQQAKALGILGAVQAIAAVTAFFLAGLLGTFLGWRYAFGLVIPLALLTLWMSRRLRPVAPLPGVRLDGTGALIALAAVTLPSLGIHTTSNWGVVLASPVAPIALLGLSPAFAMVVAGALGVQLFMAWSRRRQARHETPLLALRVIESPRQRAAALAMMAIFMLANALTFLVPLYVQMVQGRTSLETAVAMIPYQVAVFGSAILVLNLYDRLTPRQIARYSFILVAAALFLLGIEMKNAWSDMLVVAALVMFGLGQGALATLLFNLLVAHAPREFAGDVGSLRGMLKNVGAGIGTAIAGALVVGLLNDDIRRRIDADPAVPVTLMHQADFDRAYFVSNARLKGAMAGTTATPEQIDAAVRLNAESRQYALKLTFLLLGGAALLVIIPVGRLPDSTPALGSPASRGLDAGTAATFDSSE